MGNWKMNKLASEAREFALASKPLAELAKKNNIDLGDTKNVTRNAVIDLLAKEGKINQKLAESLKEDTATQRKVLDMLDQMYISSVYKVSKKIDL